MVNKPKIQGTAFETLTVNKLNEYGFKSKRLAEGGSKDKGDIECEVPFTGILPYPKIIFEAIKDYVKEDAKRIPLLEPRMINYVRFPKKIHPAMTLDFEHIDFSKIKNQG